MISHNNKLREKLQETVNSCNLLSNQNWEALYNVKKSPKEIYRDAIATLNSGKSLSADNLTLLLIVSITQKDNEIFDVLLNYDNDSFAINDQIDTPLIRAIRTCDAQAFEPLFNKFIFHFDNPFALLETTRSIKKQLPHHEQLAQANNKQIENFILTKIAESDFLVQLKYAIEAKMKMLEKMKSSGSYRKNIKTTLDDAIKTYKDSLKDLPNSLPKNINDLIRVASEQNHEDILNVLINLNVNFNIIYKDRNTPLTFAIAYTNEEFITHLLNTSDFMYDDPNMLLGLVEKKKKNLLPDSEEYKKLDRIKTLLLTKKDIVHDKKMDIHHPDFSHNYNKQVIISFHADAVPFKMRWDQSDPQNPCQVIKKNTFTKEDLSSNDLQYAIDQNDVVRVYMDAHGYPGANSLADIDCKKLATQLKKLFGNTPATLVVNLVVCGAGKYSSTEKIDVRSGYSFAAKLHQALFVEFGRNIPVVARTTTVGYEGGGLYGTIFDNRSGAKITTPVELTWNQSWWTLIPRLGQLFTSNKQPGSKVIYTQIGDDQVKIDGYIPKWKEKILAFLSDVVQRNKQNPDKAQLVKEYHERFQKLSPEEIFEVIDDREFVNVMEMHTSAEWHPSRLFPPKSARDFYVLMDEARSLFDSKYTIKQPICTGRKLTNSGE